MIVVPVEDTGDGHRGIAHEEEYDEEGNELPRRMEVPIPDTLLPLWIYLHECTHMRLFHYSRPDTNEYSRNEAGSRFGSDAHLRRGRSSCLVRGIGRPSGNSPPSGFY